MVGVGLRLHVGDGRGERRWPGRGRNLRMLMVDVIAELVLRVGLWS